MSFVTEHGKLQEYLKTLPTSTIENVRIVSVEETKDKCGYHISHNPDEQQIYIPRLPLSASPTEEATTPRITISDTIRGCMTGYGDLENLVDRKSDAVKVSGDNRYLGGLYIKQLDFSLALKPNEKLVYDSMVSDELWLVPYSTERSKYISKIIGKLIPYENTKTFNKASRKENTTITCLLEIYKANVSLGDISDKKLQKGYYRVSFNNNTTVIESIMKIDKKTWLDRKNLNASLLSIEAPMLKW